MSSKHDEIAYTREIHESIAEAFETNGAIMQCLADALLEEKPKLARAWHKKIQEAGLFD